jgi:hypothetical protein
MTNFEDMRISHMLVERKFADEKRAKSKELVEGLHDILEAHPGAAAADFHRSERARIQRERAELDLQAEIHLARAECLEDGFCPTGPDQYGDQEWMARAGQFTDQAMGLNRTKSLVSLRWPEKTSSGGRVPQVSAGDEYQKPPDWAGPADSGNIASVWGDS